MFYNSTSMSNASYQKVLNRLLCIANYYGVFYIPHNNNRTRIINATYCVITVVTSVVYHLVAFFWKMKHRYHQAEFTFIFIECMEAFALLFVSLTTLSYSFLTQAAFKEFFKVMNESEGILFKLHFIPVQKSCLVFFSFLLVFDYLLFFGLICLHGINILLHENNFQIFLLPLSDLFFIFNLFNSMNVIIYSMLYIQSLYEKALSKLDEVMKQYLIMPLEDIVEVNNGNFIITGWLKKVLEKRNDQKIGLVLASTISAVENLNTSVYLLNKIHGFHTVVIFLIFAVVSLGLINALVIHYIENLLRLIKLTLFIVLLVSIK